MTHPYTAAEWFAARLRRHDAELERAFRDWLAADPAHADEYARCEITWDLATQAARDVPLPALHSHRRRGLLAAAAMLAAAAIGGAAFWIWPADTQQWSTGAGEQRTLLLADGSRVSLNTRTRLRVHLGRGARDIELQEGEAFFEVARDAARPFTVRTALGSARAVGTHFNVYLQHSSLAVTTTEGRVWVKGATAGNGVYVDAGRQAAVQAGIAGATVREANLAAALDWRERRIEVDNVPLAQVLEEFSRYTALPVRAADPAVGALRVTAVLRAGDLQALRVTLREAFGLSMQAGPTAYRVAQTPPGLAN
ncbi:MAG: FecR domain-containing protein [Proteobacteria bacterium]|nr:FecR domain-containing protein [Pseudomonadota bacterium]